MHEKSRWRKRKRMSRWRNHDFFIAVKHRIFCVMCPVYHRLLTRPTRNFLVLKNAFVMNLLGPSPLSLHSILHWHPISSPSQTLPHKLPLRKAQPPLTRPITLIPTPILIDPRQQPTRQFLPHLHQILFQCLCFLSVSRWVEHLVERKPWVAGDGEVGV